MKRRVLRAHNNKKNIRAIQAAHRLKEPHHILCDETFLRSAAEHKCEDLKDLLADAIGSCVVHVLPETLAALERHKQVKVLNTIAPQCHVLTAGSTFLSSTTTSSDQQQQQPSASSTATNVDENKKAAAAGSSGVVLRNELKAICQTVKTAKQYFFVATQSHDLRSMLPPRLGVLRCSFQPLAVWLEPAGSEVQSRNNPSSTSSNTSTGGRQQPSPMQPTTKTISAADAAFMKTLGIEKKPSNNSRRDANRKKAVPLKTSTETTSATTTAAPVVAPSAAPRVRKPLKHKIKGPNPLSMKKKSVRETFSIDEEPPKSKRRVE